MFKFVLLLLATLTVLFTVTSAEEIKCTHPNEEYQCGSACQTTCDTLGQPCPIVNIKCNDACYCIDAYARNSNGVCIPIKDCPPKRRSVKHNRSFLPFLRGLI